MSRIDDSSNSLAHALADGKTQDTQTMDERQAEQEESLGELRSSRAPDSVRWSI